MPAKPFVAPATWKVLLLRGIMSIVGLFWAIFVMARLLMVTIRKRGSNFKTVERSGACDGVWLCMCVMLMSRA